MQKINKIFELQLYNLIRSIIIKKHEYLQQLKTISFYFLSFLIATSSLYVIYTYPKITLQFFYILLFVLFISIHILLFKKPNLTLQNSTSIEQSIQCNHGQVNLYKLIIKIFMLQLQIFIISNWLLENLLLQGKLNIKFHLITTDLCLSKNFLNITNSLINWLIFVSLLLSLSIYRYYLQKTDLRVAKYLVPNPNNHLKTFYHNLILNLEFYIRTASMYVLFILIAVNLFEYYANKYQFKNFLEYPLISSFLIVLTLSFTNKTIKNLISYFCKKTSLNLVNIVSIVFFIICIGMFISIQLILSHLNNIGIINNTSSSNPQLLEQLFHNHSLNQERIKILFISLFMIFNFSLITDVVVKQVVNFKLKTIYKITCIFPTLYFLISLNQNISNLLNKYLTKQTSTFYILFITLCLFNINYKKIHHLLCAFRLKMLKDNSPQKIRTNFEKIIYQLIATSFIYLNFYYVTSWIFIEHFLGIATILGLPIIIILVNKIFYHFKTENYSE